MPVTIPVLAAAGVYAGALANGFVFDDELHILDNPWIRDLSHLSEIFTRHVWAFAARDSNYYRPLMHLVYAALYVPFGPAAAVFHGVNVVLHACATFLVFALVRHLTCVPGGDGAPSVFPWAAFLAALVFAVHPIHVEAVAWVSGLPDLACGAFYLAALLAFVAAGDSPRRAGVRHAAGALCFLAAALFKEPGITLPGAVLAIDLARRPGGLGRSYWITRYGALAAAAALYLALRGYALGGVAPQAAESTFNLARALDLGGVALSRYAALLVVPYPLNAFQTLESATGLPAWAALTALAAVVLVVLRLRSAAWTAALALFLLPLLPALFAPALVPGLENPWAERYLYLPSAGYAAALGIAGAALFGARGALRRFAFLAVLGVVLLFSGMTVARVRVWRDDLTLWSDTVAKSPHAGAAHGALGHALFVHGRIDEAIAEYERALELQPEHVDSLVNLGVAWATQGRHQAALRPYAEALRLRPELAVARADLAISLSMMGRHEEALGEARQAVELQPQLAKGRHALGVALGNAGRLAEAAVEFRRALALDPRDAQSRVNLARAEAALR